MQLSGDIYFIIFKIKFLINAIIKALRFNYLFNLKLKCIKINAFINFPFKAINAPYTSLVY
jgi:hypothetical protein